LEAAVGDRQHPGRGGVLVVCDLARLRGLMIPYTSGSA
jgi:hypothetical protein